MPELQWTRALPTLSADLVTVREVVASDAPALFNLLSDPRVSAHMSCPPPSVRAFEGFIAWARAERSNGRGVCYGIVPDGMQSAAGIIQLHTVEPTFCVSGWGFAIAPAFWSTGVFLQAVQLVAAFAFGTIGVERLEARVTPTNGRANGILQKLGGTVEAVLSRALYRGGKYDEQLLWSLTKETWAHRTSRPRFCPADAKARIAEAVAVTQQTLIGAAIPSAAAPPLYPFFLAHSRPVRH